MSRRSLRDELRDVFDDLSEPAHPALSARIRHQLESAGPAPRVPRLAVAVAWGAAALVIVGLLLVGRHAVTSQPQSASTPPSTPVASSAPSLPTSPGPTASASPSASPDPTLPGFSCTVQTGGGPAYPAPPVGVTAVRAAAQTGFERFVIQLSGPVPQFDVKPQTSATFVQVPSGQKVTLSGTAGLVVTLHGAQSYGTYSGATDLHPGGTSVIKEARQLGDFEGVLTWGLGLSHASCFRAYTLTGPSRLIVDVQS